jgi:hypothetical protein
MTITGGSLCQQCLRTKEECLSASCLSRQWARSGEILTRGSLGSLCSSVASFYKWNWGWGDYVASLRFHGLLCCLQAKWIVKEGTFRMTHVNSVPLAMGLGHSCRPCPQWRAPPAPSILGLEPVHIYSFKTCTLLFYFHGPALVFALGALFMHIAGGPLFNLSSGLNITTAITRGPTHVTPFQRLQTPPQVTGTGLAPARLRGSSFLNGNFHRKWWGESIHTLSLVYTGGKARKQGLRAPFVHLTAW